MERLRKELTVASLSIAFGLLVLPIAIYYAGRQLIGEYAPDATVLTLALDIWSGVARLEPGAWLLALGPYLVVQIARFTSRVWRSAPV